jgi:hypothetical protein
VAEDAVNVDAHLFLGEVFDEFHVAVADCVHEGVPVVGGGELVYEVGEGVEEAYYLFCISLLCVRQ